MKCAHCRSNATVNTPFGERNYCDKHFMESIEKRIRKDLRISKKLSTKKKYSLLKNNTHEFHLTKYFLDKIFKGRLKYTLTTGKADIVPGSLDSETNDFLDTFLKNKEKKKKFVLLRNVSQKEMKEVCRILGIKFNNKINGILDKLEEEHPGTKFSVLRTSDFIYKK